MKRLSPHGKNISDLVFVTLVYHIIFPPFHFLIFLNVQTDIMGNSNVELFILFFYQKFRKKLQKNCEKKVAELEPL